MKECRHVAIIMDGNGRWAKAQGKPRTQDILSDLTMSEQLPSQQMKWELNI